MDYLDELSYALVGAQHNYKLILVQVSDNSSAVHSC
jgi:hypothetical protein